MPSKVWHEIACFRRGPFTVTVDRAKDPLLFKKSYRAVVSVCGVDVGKTYGTDQADVVARASRMVDRAVRTTGGPVQPSGMAMPRWTSTERDILKTAVASHRTDGGGVDWAKVAKSVTDYGYAKRTPAACQRYVLARLKAGRDFCRRPDGSIGVTADAQ